MRAGVIGPTVNRRSLVAALLVGAMVLGTVAPATAVPGLSSTQTEVADTDDSSLEEVGVGQQIATVVTAESETVQGDVERIAQAASFERVSEARRAELIAEQTAEVDRQATALRVEYRDATAEYRAGEMGEAEYARRIAVLNARAQSLTDRITKLRERAANVSTLELRAAGVNRSVLTGIEGRLEAVSGTGPRALLARFTGERTGSVAIETTEASISISVDGDGARSRQVERDGDADTALAVNQSTALSTARTALADGAGQWVLVGSAVDSSKGVYSFEFTLDADNSTGDARVAVDGSANTVIGLESEVEPIGGGTDDTELGGLDPDEGADEGESRDDEEETDDTDERARNDTQEAEDDGLVLVVAVGRAAPGETVALRALAGGEPAANVTVAVGNRVVGTTDADGTIPVTLPADDVTVTAIRGDASASLDFEFEEEDPVLRDLSVSAGLEGDSVTATVFYQGDAVPNARVLADGRAVGTTNAAGQVTFPTDATEDLTLTVVMGAFETEYRFVVVNDSLVPADEAVGSGVGAGDDGDETDDDGNETDDGATTDDGNEADNENETDGTDTDDTADDEGSDDGTSDPDADDDGADSGDDSDLDGSTSDSETEDSSGETERETEDTTDESGETEGETADRGGDGDDDADDDR